MSNYSRIKPAGMSSDWGQLNGLGMLDCNQMMIQAQNVVSQMIKNKSSTDTIDAVCDDWNQAFKANGCGFSIARNGMISGGKGITNKNTNSPLPLIMKPNQIPINSPAGSTNATSYAMLPSPQGFALNRTIAGLAADPVPTGDTSWQLYAGGAVLAIVLGVIVAKYVIK